jgi:hypothetical protein
MKSVRITKFIGTQQTSAFTIPGFAISLAARLLPQPALDALAEKGVCLAAIAQASRYGQPYAQTMVVEEGGIQKAVTISVDAFRIVRNASAPGR